MVRIKRHKKYKFGRLKVSIMLAIVKLRIWLKETRLFTFKNKNKKV